MLCDRLDLGGAETHIATLANALSLLGHEVCVVSGGGRLSSSLSDVKHITLPMYRKKSFLFLRSALRRIIRQGKFDVIHAHTRFSAFLVRPLAKGRLVTTAHWVFDTRFPKRQLTVWGDETLAVSHDIALYLQENYGVAEEKITLTVNGIDTRRFYPQKKASARVRIVCCTRMDHDRADAAFALLECAVTLPPDAFSLLFIGDGDRYFALKERASELKKAHPSLDVTLLGGVSDVASYLRDADIFVGVSRAALEGMASGCAVILAGNEGYLSVFSPHAACLAEKTNFCCRNDVSVSPYLLSRDLMHLLSLSRRELYALGKECRDYVCARYSAEQMARDALSVYQKICKREIVLCGYYGFHNVGDDLLEKTISSRLKALGYRRILLLSRKRLSLSAFRALWRASPLLLGGGTLLQDATSRRSLWFYLFCARVARGRLYVCGGIGPLSPRGESAVSRLLPRADRVFCRTAGDLAHALTLGARTASLSYDPVLSLPFPPKKKGEYLLLAFRAPSEDKFPALCAFVFRLCRIYGKENIRIFAMHPMDEKAAHRLARLCGITALKGDAGVFLSVLSNAFCVCASRLHAGICALGMGIPFLLWEEDEKCRFFVKDVKSVSETGRFCGTFSLTKTPPLPPCDEKEMRAAKRALLQRG